MESPNLVKVVAAFVAGVVIALGSALIYVRVNEMVRPEPVVLAQAPADVPQAAVIQPQDPVQQPTPAPLPVNAPSPRVVRAAPVERPKKPASKLVMHHQPKIALAQLAQNHVPATVPLPVPVTYAAQQVDTSAAEAGPAIDPGPMQPPQAPEPAPAPQPHAVTLQPGTAISIRLSEPLSTDHNYTGDTFRGTLQTSIVRDGFIIAERGSKVLGRIVSADRAGAGLSLTLTEINTTDGQRIPVDTTPFEQTGPTRIGQDAATIAGGVALGAMIGAAAGGGRGAAIGAGIGGVAGTGAVLATRPKPAALPVETRLTFRLATPLTITEKLN